MRLNNRYRTKIAGFCFILPALLVVGLLLLYPVVSSIFTASPPNTSSNPDMISSSLITTSRSSQTKTSGCPS